MNEKHYELQFLSPFEDYLNEIVEYITYRLKNPAAAERLVDNVESAILKRLPCAELDHFLCGDWKHYRSTTDLV